MHQRGTRGARPVRLLVGSLVLVAATYASGGAAAPGPALAGVVSGSRLRAMLDDGGEGALRFTGWFDSELGLPCVFERTRGGQMRCFPGPPAVFSDPTCAMPVWQRTRDFATLPPYVTAFLHQGGIASAVYALGEPYTGAVRSTGGNRCMDSYATSGSFYGTGAEIPAERFVAGEIRTLPIESGALAVRESLGADGSSWVSVEANRRFSQATRLDELPPDTVAYRGSGRLRVLSYVDGQGQVLEAMMLDGFFDTEADAPCHVERFADGLRCVPRSVASTSVDGPYLDASCTMRLSQRSPSRSGVSEPPPGHEAFAVETDGSLSTAHTLGEMVIPETVYFDPSACHPIKARAVADVVYRRLGTTAPDSQWAPVAARME